jgi:hypothetical protein
LSRCGSEFFLESLETRLVFSVIFVDAIAPASGADGSSWVHALPDLQTALSMAVSGDEIHVATGTYRPSLADQTISFAMKSGVALRGAYAGLTNPADPDARDWFSHPSILSGDIGAAGNSSDNSYHIIVANAVDASAVLDGFTITAGNAWANGSTSVAGGGFFISAGAPTIRNCTFVRNAAKNGGAVYVVGADYFNPASPAFVNCTFNGNQASTGGEIGGPGGGAIFGYFSNVSLTNCSFVGNIAWQGGGIYSSFSALHLTNCTVTANQSISWGGGIYSDQSTSFTVANSIVYANQGFGTPGAQIYGSGQFTYDDIQGGANGTGNINASPAFVRAPAIGADNTWGTADDDYGNLHLAFNSPCVDSASNAAAAGVATDIEGSARISDMPGVHDPGAIADMGVFERTLNFTATGGGFAFDRATPAVYFALNAAASLSSISIGDVSIQPVLANGSLGNPIGITAANYDTATSSVYFVPAQGALADGNYAGSLSAGSINDGYGNSISPGLRVDFFVLAGDANRDRMVDLTDFTALAANFNRRGRTFSQGNFDYDPAGNVDLTDFTILAANFNKTLSPPLPASPFAPVTASADDPDSLAVL